MQFTFDHIVLNVADIDSMLNFYTQVLQLPGERLAEYSAGEVPFPSVRLSADSIIDLFPKKLWEKSNPEQVCRPNLNHFCLACREDEAKALRVRLAEMGIEIDEGPVKRWGAHGSGTSIYFRDPEQNTIEVRYYNRDDDPQNCLLSS